MALGSTFWSTGGAAALWYDLSTFNNGKIATGPDADGTLPLWLGPCKIYQEPSSVGGNENRIQNDPGHDSGYFYAKEVSTGVVLRCHSVFHIGVPYVTVSAVNGQWEFLDPPFNRGDLLPKTTAASNTNQYDKNPIYKTGFMRLADAARPPYIEGSTPVALKVYVENAVGSWRLWHYDPFAWYGTPPEVMAAVAMHAGLDSSHLDTDSFDDAHDAYDVSAGDSPWADLGTQWTIYAQRKVGEKVADFLLQCAEHGRDYIFVNEAGKLAVSSRTSPTNVATGLELGDDQVLDVLEWKITTKHMVNILRSGWGAAARQSWEDTDGTTGSNPGSREQSVAFEPNLESRPGDKWVHDAENTTASAKYGKRWLPGRNIMANFRGHPQAVNLSHFPFLLSPHVSLSSFWEWDVDTDGGGMVHVTNWLASDAKPVTEIKIKQGPMGFDLGIGDKITNVALTGDGRTIGEVRVMERKYDFDSLTISSVLQEVPTND